MRRDAARFPHLLPATVRLPSGRLAETFITDCSLDGARLALACDASLVEVSVCPRDAELTLVAEVVRAGGDEAGVRWVGGDVAALRRDLMALQRDLLRRGIRPVPERRSVARS